MLVYSQNSYIDALNLNVITFRSGTFGGGGLLGLNKVLRMFPSTTTPDLCHERDTARRKQSQKDNHHQEQTLLV
jgi:hypothetical protein